MAVMATEGVAIEEPLQKLPVPSSDMMALDLNINGDRNSFNHHESVIESRPTLPDTPNPNVESSPLDGVASSTVINGGANMDAFMANNTLDTPPADVPLESQSQSLEEPSAATETSNSIQIQSSIITGEEPLGTTGAMEEDLFAEEENDAPEPPVASTADSVIDNEISAAVEDIAPTSTAPPVIEAQESDLRHTSPLAAFTSTATEDLELTIATEPLDQADLPVETLGPNFTNPATSQAVQDLDLRVETVEPIVADLSVAPAQDVDMVDAPPPPCTKVSRLREDDGEDEPAAKRAKTEDEAMPNVESQELMSNGLQNGVAQAGNAGPITPYMVKHIGIIIKNTQRTKDGKGFYGAVATLWPALAELYLSKVSHPMDLTVMEAKLKRSEYASMAEFWADLDLIVANCVTFNGPDHMVTRSARIMQQYIKDKVANMRPESIPNPKAAKPTKKATSRKSTPVVDANGQGSQVRRPSRGAAATAAPTFALNPTTNTPTIRRDISKGEGGRPKREIHPPKNKGDLAYHTSKAKTPELRFCEDVLQKMKQQKHHKITSAFLAPVDPVLLNIPDYYQKIKEPMDMQTVSEKLAAGSYSKAADFRKDMQLIVANCLKYNPPGNPVRVMGEQFQELFDTEWRRKDSFLQALRPARASTAATSDEDESEEEEPEAAQPAAESQFTDRLVEEQSKLITLMANKNTNKGILDFQKNLVAQLMQNVADEKAQQTVKKPKKAKAPKQVKKPAPNPSSKRGGGQNRGRNPNKYMGTIEKEVISSGIGDLPQNEIEDVTQWILAEEPNAKNEDGELELDIETISVPLLWRIYNLVIKHSPSQLKVVRERMTQRSSPEELARPAPKKKNKPMTKYEQEAKIERLKNQMAGFQAGVGSGSEQEPIMQTVEQDGDDETSGDESDSEEE